MNPQEHVENLARGLYERVIDDALETRLHRLRDSALVERAAVEEADAPAVLAQHMGQLLRNSLAAIRGPEQLTRQISICNRIVAFLSEVVSDSVGPDLAVSGEAQRLLAIAPRSPGLAQASVDRPATPLSVSCLLTGTRVDPSLVSELRKELASSDRVDILCSFIKWSGIRVLDDALRAFASRASARLRIITTAYMGATDPRAVDFLARLPGAELKVSYDTRRTRLHAKAYLFHRNTGFGTAYVGSSNLSNAALTDGLEWNVKISQYETVHLWEKLCGTFETYWNDTEFVGYSADQRERLCVAIQGERPGGREEIAGFQFDIQPFPYQQEILDALEADRVYHNRHRNLVVAATGTGKTVVAAFDYKRFAQKRSPQSRERYPRLLFVAHREEILKQSLACFRGVLRDANFGDLLVGPQRPDSMDHLFVSIQSFNSQHLAGRIAPAFYDFVIIDEFHHAEAPSYQRLLQHVRPQILLGLTATPERADGLDVVRHFGGHICAEIRLADAINRKMLCPFQYFGITDLVDLSALTWRRGGYAPAELEQQFTANDVRADLVVRSVQEKLVDPLKARGLGFCVSVRHAGYMADFFMRCGIPAESLSAESPQELRRTVQRRLESGEINFIFTVDLYNEGVDIPLVDTVLLLRPTESLTVFLQQLGRGLRLHEGKDCLTVLDFIGQAHRSYNWEMRFRALMDRPRKRIDQEIEGGCLHVPLGCFIHLERIAQKHVLENIRTSLSGSAIGLIRRVARFEEDSGRSLTLANFLDHYGWEPDEIFRRGSWSRLCVRAAVRPDFSDPDENVMTKGLRRIAHLNGPRTLRKLIRLLAGTAGARLDPDAEQLLLMLHVTLWRDWRPGAVAEDLERLARNPTLHGEMLDLLSYRYDRLSEAPPELRLPFNCSLELHASYTRDQILVGLGSWSLSEQREVREGVLYIPDLATDVFFVTLNKTESDYSPTTLYEDYAISAERFHWQSQSTTSESSATGQRYIHHEDRGGTILLFVREDKRRNGLACPYDFLGPISYESHRGSRPMSIVWRLKYPIPARLLAGARRLEAA